MTTVKRRKVDLKYNITYSQFIYICLVRHIRLILLKDNNFNVRLLYTDVH